MIVMGLKTVENKAVPFPSTLPLPCTLAVHASSNGDTIGDDIDDLCDDDMFCEAFSAPCEPLRIGKDYFYSQTIVGLIDVVGCVDVTGIDDAELAFAEFGLPDGPFVDNTYHDWANGPYCLVLKNPRRFKTGIMTRGQLGYWKLTPEVQQLVIEHSNHMIDIPHLPTAPINGVPKCLGKLLPSRS